MIVVDVGTKDKARSLDRDHPINFRLGGEVLDHGEDGDQKAGDGEESNQTLDVLLRAQHLHRDQQEHGVGEVSEASGARHVSVSRAVQQQLRAGYGGEARDRHIQRAQHELRAGGELLEGPQRQQPPGHCLEREQ